MDDDSERGAEERLRVLLEREEDTQVVTENSIRVSLFRYRLLNNLELCHVIDKYTGIRPTDETAGKTFFTILKTTECLQSLFGTRLLDDLKAVDAEKVTLYERAVQLSARVVDPVTVPGCSTCNAAMNHSITHSDVVFRCFPYTSATQTLSVLHTSKDRRSDRVGMTKTEANKIKKWIQQVALFFHPPTTETPHWHLKTAREVTLDASLYRAVANLHKWATTGVPRFRMIAIFYSAWFVFHDQLVRETGLTFARWHLHSFRDTYMRLYRADTWFGMKQTEAAVLFDITRGEPAGWLQLVRQRLQGFASTALARALDSTDDGKIDSLWEAVHTHVSDERTLMHFACQKLGVDKGLRVLFAYFIFNVQDPYCSVLLKRTNAFLAEAAAIIREERGSIMRLRPAQRPKALTYAADEREP